MKFIGYILEAENDTEWKFKLLADLDEGSMVLNKKTHEASIQGLDRTLKYVMSSDFIKNFALKVLSHDPHKKRFAHGHG